MHLPAFVRILGCMASEEVSERHFRCLAGVPSQGSWLPETVVEAGTKSGVPGRGMAFPSFWFAIRPSTAAFAATAEGEEVLLPEELALQV
jgi:hypothetical protein